MYTRLEKNECIAKNEKRIAKRNELVSFYNDIYIPTLKAFDGKVYNIRFINALRKKVEDNKLFWVNAFEYDHIRVELRLNEFSYNEHESFYCPLVLDDNGRISYEKTMEFKYKDTWYDNFVRETQAIQDVIDHYDDYIKVENELQKAIDKWNKLPLAFRENFRTDWVHIY